MTTALSLYTIEARLLELADLRDQLEAEGDKEALDAVDAEIANYLTREAAKIDSYAGLIRQRLDAAALCEKRAKDLQCRAKAMKADAQRLKDNALRVMQSFNVTKLVTPETTLRIQGNGGLRPLEIGDESILPDEYKLISVLMPYQEWLQLLKLWQRQVGGLPKTMQESVIPDADKLREALSQKVICPDCASYPHGEMCPRCDGVGYVDARIAGARLGERGIHVRVE